MTLDGIDLVYSVLHDSIGSTVDGVILVRASTEFRNLAAPRLRPPRPVGGATVGPLWVGHERETNTVWLDSVAVPLDTNNVLFVDVDSYARPQVAGLARIEPRLEWVPRACDSLAMQQSHELFAGALRARLSDSPRVRAFLFR